MGFRIPLSEPCRGCGKRKQNVEISRRRCAPRGWRREHHNWPSDRRRAVVRRLAAFGKGGGDASVSPPESYDSQTERVGALNKVEVERWPELPDSKTECSSLSHGHGRQESMRKSLEQRRA
jgi:hypothetical protein